MKTKKLSLIMFIFSLSVISTNVLADTAITSLPFTISSPGSYYLTGNLTSDTSGITVMVNDVTIDLKNYSITGTSAVDSSGIYFFKSNNGVVKNGTVRKFHNGIYATGSGVGLTKITNVSAMENVWGMRIGGFGSHIEKCNVNENTYGIHAQGKILYNVASYNTYDGIYAGFESIIIGNITSYNGADGIRSAAGSTMIQNTSSRNTEDGLRCSGSCAIIGNTAYFNQAIGIYPGSRSTVKNNTANSNGSFGIYLGVNSYSVFDGNVAIMNGTDMPFSGCTTCGLGANVPQ